MYAILASRDSEDQNPIERFRLPNPASSPKRAVDKLCRCTLDCSHNLSQRIDLVLRGIDQWGENEVNVIGHDHCGVKEMFRVVVMKTTSQNDRSSILRKNPPLKCAESHKVPLEVPLQMKQFPPVEHNSRSDSRLGCPAKAKPSGINPKA